MFRQKPYLQVYGQQKPGSATLQPTVQRLQDAAKDQEQLVSSRQELPVKREQVRASSNRVRA